MSTLPSATPKTKYNTHKPHKTKHNTQETPKTKHKNEKSQNQIKDFSLDTCPSLRSLALSSPVLLGRYRGFSCHRVVGTCGT